MVECLFRIASKIYMHKKPSFFPDYKEVFIRLGSKDTSTFFIKNFLLIHPLEDVQTFLNLRAELIPWFSQDQINNMALQNNGLKALEYISCNRKTLFCIPQDKLVIPKTIHDEMRAEAKNFTLFATCIRSIYGIVINNVDPAEKLEHLTENNKSIKKYHFTSKLQTIDYSTIEDNTAIEPDAPSIKMGLSFILN